MFVLVPSTSNAKVESIQTASLSTNKIYFMAKYNQIVAKGTVYGVDPSTGAELQSLVDVLGGTKNPDTGEVSVDFSNLNYYTSEGTKTIIGAIRALDAKIKSELDKFAASKTLDVVGDSYEFTGKLKYVAAVPAAEGKDAVPAHIALVNEAQEELSTIAVSDIIGNGVLKTSAYDAATGILTLTFAQADGTEKAIQVDLKAMLDINDISIAEASKKYLEVTLGSADAEGETQAVFGAKIVKVSEASDSLTGLADAKDVKDYVDGKTTDLAITAEGDDYVTARVDAGVDKRHVIVTADVQNVTYTAGTHTTYTVEGAVDIAGRAANIEGVANSLVDGAQATAEVKKYVDFVVAEEAARADAKVLAAIKALDKASDTVGSSNVHVAYKEEDGIVTIESVTEDYATVTRGATTSTSGAPKTDASLTVTVGDEEKLVKAKDLKAVAEYAADKATEEAHRVDKKIADTITGLNVPETEVSESGEGAVKFKYSETAGKVAVKDLSVTYATHSANTLSTGIVNGTTLNAVLADMWETYVDA